MNKQTRLTRRQFIKAGGGFLTAAVLSRLASRSLSHSGETALAAAAAQTIVPDVHLAATDGWIYLPGQVPIPGTTDQYYNPDPWAPSGLTTYMFGFRDVTGLTQEQIIAQKMKCQASAPMFWVNELQEYRLRLSNLGLQMRPDLVDSHTVHWHGFRNAWPVFDGEPHSSLAVPIGASLDLFYRPRDPGTYMYHCHFEETEHVHMGMTGSVFVRPRQDGTDYEYPLGSGRYYTRFAYNDGDGSTGYDREFVVCLTDVWAEAHWDDAHIQLPDWTDFRADYYLMNGRVYPDTVVPNGNSEAAPWQTDAGGDLIPPPGRPELQYQPISSLIEAEAGERVLIRFINLTFGQQAMTLPGLKMRVVGKDATHLRGRDGTDYTYETNTLYFGSGSSADVIITMPMVTTPQTYYLFNRNYDRLVNPGVAGLGGQMTEIRVYPNGVLAPQTLPNTNPRL
jgi:FtsP/CotA-like multicopper oxidase with cupredoxin domain